MHFCSTDMSQSCLQPMYTFSLHFQSDGSKLHNIIMNYVKNIFGLNLILSSIFSEGVLAFVCREKQIIFSLPPLFLACHVSLQLHLFFFLRTLSVFVYFILFFFFFGMHMLFYKYIQHGLSSGTAMLSLVLRFPLAILTTHQGGWFLVSFTDKEKLRISCPGDVPDFGSEYKCPFSTY